MSYVYTVLRSKTAHYRGKSKRVYAHVEEAKMFCYGSQICLGYCDTTLGFSILDYTNFYTSSRENDIGFSRTCTYCTALQMKHDVLVKSACTVRTLRYLL